MSERSEFEHHQWLPLFTGAINVTLIAQYWLIPGTGSSVICISRIDCESIKLKEISKN